MSSVSVANVENTEVEDIRSSRRRARHSRIGVNSCVRRRAQSLAESQQFEKGMKSVGIRQRYVKTPGQCSSLN